MRSAKKAVAVRRNAKRGDRQPTFQLGDRARANDHAPGDYRHRVGTVTEIRPSKSEYLLEYDDDGQPNGYLMSWWINREPA